MHPLSSWTQWLRLDLGQNSISDLKPLTTLKNLQQLFLVEHQIQDLSPLVSPKQLIILMSGSSVTELSPLRSLERRLGSVPLGGGAGGKW
ncbi:hypothetical protein NDA01_28445 [Trichocoleus desertorum AS-A10]|uniref:leucine-rich repeat domain-containing protein n=1 Tax=Trichocoleus desertorum TaxID=1481672 RepID=UPI003297CB6C